MPDNSLNQSLISFFLELFIDEINILGEIEEKYLLEDKKTIIEMYNRQNPIIFQGYGRIHTLSEAMDEIEFHQNILSFFNKNGKMILNSSFIDNRYELDIAVSYFNIDKNEIEIITANSKQECEEHTSFVHLFWLSSLKTMIYSLLAQLKNNNQTSTKIKIGSNKFKELLKNVTNNRIDSDSTAE